MARFLLITYALEQTLMKLYSFDCKEINLPFRLDIYVEASKETGFGLLPPLSLTRSLKRLRNEGCHKLISPPMPSLQIFNSLEYLRLQGFPDLFSIPDENVFSSSSLKVILEASKEKGQQIVVFLAMDWIAFSGPSRINKKRLSPSTF
ncbi:hypothetical protein POTOM_059064 [Populus tomentosa]|uniref:Uncharacterized protein n=1 Tax=Populus tomentosa TaxID=118781 RepID=A0A8X7XVF8_POPTO|nr:hypothetical protein POTOM_059064 [Populus tomentosa]